MMKEGKMENGELARIGTGPAEFGQTGIEIELIVSWPVSADIGDS